ncbi:hypothetical protein RHMOL_Rhmol04G0339700 [Rhododendron molle]|uniref:Uncharacterized protein n=1 Tax=Rhododendron molle TaxID=49168 RepID=A0ACC0P753_RHOML|nr:hypothetical protein RHMOL_Rhmol04G0339700 [Rhododendron molle]
MRVFLEFERNVVFISDRNIGLLHAVADVFPGASHSYCLVHLKKNLRTRLGGVAMDWKRYLVELFGKCAYAPTLELFNELLAELERESGNKMRDFLSDLDVKHWAHAYFPGHRYGELSSNLAECFNRWIKDERCLPVTQLVDAIRMKLMEQMSRRKEESLRWKTTVCSTWDKRLAGLFQFSRTWVVRKSSADVYDVRGNPSNTVNICQRRCTCREWQLNCFPCVHAVCAIRKSGRDLNDFVEPCYLVYSFRRLIRSRLNQSLQLINQILLLIPMTLSFLPCKGGQRVGQGPSAYHRFGKLLGKGYVLGAGPLRGAIKGLARNLFLVDS